MGEIENTDTVEVQASVLAEKTITVSLEDLAQLCPEAEQIIEDLLAIQQVSSEVLLTLGLENQRELRAFVERVILNTSHSPQDLLAAYLYQGRAARKAGIDPRDWNLRVHRPMRLVCARVLHSLSSGKELPKAVQGVYGLGYACIKEGMDELKAQLLEEAETGEGANAGSGSGSVPASTDGLDNLQQKIEAKLTLASRVEFLLRKGAAMRLMREALETQHGLGSHDAAKSSDRKEETSALTQTHKSGALIWNKVKPVRSGRIPMSALRVVEAPGVLQGSQG